MDIKDFDHLTLGQTEAEGHTPGDWVKDLFAPIYSFDDVVAAGRDGFETNKRRIQRVPILDPEAVREVFERVHQRVVESEQKKLEEERIEKEEEAIKNIDPRKSSIWNTEELDTLRQVYKAAKGEIHRLEIALREKSFHNTALETTVSKQRQETEEVQAKLKEAVKSNQRLVIHRDSLQKDLAVLEAKQAALTDMWHEIEADRVKAMEHAKNAQIELDKERLTRQKSEAELVIAKQDLIRETALVETNVKAKYEMEISDLQEVVRDLTVELRDERKLHEASKRGLEHLRNHFSSLPLQSILPSHVVVKDEVGRIDHCSL